MPDIIAPLRQKVIAFESEMNSSLSILGIMEKELENVCALREDWMTEVSGVDDAEAVTFKNRIASLRKRAELIMIEIQIDSIRLNGFYEG